MTRPGLNLTASLAAFTKLGGGGEIRFSSSRFSDVLDLFVFE